MNTHYTPTIGLEVHAELKTRTKMFCSSRNDPDEKRPNSNVCPICMGHPGTLPVINKEAVRHVLRIGVALSGKLADFTEFDRKNYFYPDIPKGYQISQYAYPLVKGGKLSFVPLERVHLEEDTARSTHDTAEQTLIDFNRAGVPLMELVTKPVIKSGEEAVAFARELQLLLRTLGAGEANMEKGEMRIEGNISVSADEKLGTKVEVKNLNSFRAVEYAINFEIKRQSDLLASGGKIIQETRGWDEKREQTFSQRLKEESHDYRYFPDPDLPKLMLSEIPEFTPEKIRASLPELPQEKRARLLAFGIKHEDVESLLSGQVLENFFNDVIRAFGSDTNTILRAINYLTSDVVGLMKKHDLVVEEGTIGRLTPESYGKLMGMVGTGKVSSRGAKDILAILLLEGGDPGEVASSRNLFQKGEEELQEVIESIIREHDSVVSDYKKGKESALQFLIGKGMAVTKGSANPEILKKLLISRLAE